MLAISTINANNYSHRGNKRLAVGCLVAHYWKTTNSRSPT